MYYVNALNVIFFYPYHWPKLLCYSIACLYYIKYPLTQLLLLAQMLRHTIVQELGIVVVVYLALFI